MKIKKNYTATEVQESAKIGIEFEFYSSMDIYKTGKELAKFIKKRIVIPMSMSTINDPKPLYHSPVTPTSDIFKLEPDYSGGNNMCELVTGPMEYREARNIIIKTFEWIQNNGYTNERCSIHLNLSINGNKIHTTYDIKNLVIPKFILTFDEKKIYKVFPKRENSVYARSIKNIRLNNVLFYSPSLEEFSRATLKMPSSSTGTSNDEKYYGVNFLKANNNYLEYRYLGGQDYEKKGKDILDLLNYFILHLFDTLNFTGYTDKEKADFKRMIDLDKQLYEGFIKYAKFKKLFPEIKVTADMNDDPQVLETMWVNIREKLYDLIVTGGMRKGNFNYDTEIGRYQLKDTKLTNCKVADVEFIKCKVEGIIERSWFFDCDISNARLLKCSLTKGNVLKFSKASDCELYTYNSCEDCYIESNHQVINCEVIRGVIRNGEIGKLAKVSKETLIVTDTPIESGNAGSSSFADAKQNKENKKSGTKKQ